MFDSITDAISVINRDVYIVRVNRTMGIWHQDMMPLVGKKCHYAYHNRSEPCEWCPCRIAIAEGTPWTGIVPREVAGRTVGWQEVFAFPLRDDGGAVVGAVSYARDITERRHAEEAMREAKAQAELYVDLMGHDINNMHQISLGYLELARNELTDERLREYVDRPIEVLQRCARLIQNVRKLQRLRDGEFLPGIMDVAEVLRQVQREYGGVPHKTVRLHPDGAGHCPVVANELLYDVFANLVSNAIKHTGSRTDINIGLGTVERDGHQFCGVTVDDNGPGIPDGFKDVVFNRMLKGTQIAKGMGLGLYRVKSLVESYGGTVWVEDRVPGDYFQGAKFVVMLPVA